MQQGLLIVAFIGIALLAYIVWLVQPRLNEVQIAAGTIYGELIHLPNMRATYEHWPDPSTSPRYESLKKYIDDLLVQAFGGVLQAAKYKTDDFALLTARWYPSADITESETLVAFVAWLHCFGRPEEINEDVPKARLESAAVLRVRTIALLEGLLDVGRSKFAMDEDEIIDDVNRLLVPVCEKLRASMDIDRRRTLFDEIRFHVEACATELENRRNGKVLPYHEYMSVRLGSSAVYPLGTLMEYALGFTFPDWVLQSKDFTDLRTNANICIVLTQDLLSIKRDMRTLRLINAVLSARKGETKLKGAVDFVLDQLYNAAANVDFAAAALMEKTNDDPEVHEHIGVYIHALKGAVSGLNEYYLRSQKLDVEIDTQADGSMRIEL